MLNRQLMFDDAAKHMARQRAKAVQDGCCVYRGPKGVKCIIGALIPDSSYRPSFDGLTENGLASQRSPFHDVIYSLDKKYGEIADTLSDKLFCVELQAVHDECRTDKEGWDHLRRQLFEKFYCFSKQYGLDFTVARRVLTREEVVPSCRSIPAFVEGDDYDPEDNSPSY